MGGYRGEKEEEALCVKGMRLGGRGLFTAAANFGLRNFYLDGAFVYECSPMICLVQVPRGPVPRDVWFQFLLSES